MLQIEGIAYHHTGDSSPDPQFAKVDNYHKNQGFPKSTLGFYVGYTYFIGKSGAIKQARLEDERGAHTVNCGCAHDLSGLPYNTANLHYIAICFAGKLSDKEPPTQAQLASAVMLTEDIQRRRGVTNEKLFNHRDFKATSCPGIDLAGEVRRIIDLRKRLKLAQLAVEKALPPRRNGLQRFIKRVIEILSPYAYGNL